MTRNMGIFGTLLGAMLMLTGCTGGSAPAEDAPEQSAPAPSAEAPSQEAPSSGALSPSDSESAAAADLYSDEELTELVSALEDAEGQPLTVVPAAQLDQGLAQAEQLLDSATITPEACSVFATDNLQPPEDANYAAGATQSAAQGTQTTITVFSMPDPGAIEEQISAALNAAEECSTYEVETEGQTISSEIEPVEVQTDGEMSFGALTTQTLGNGETQTILSVSGVQGTLAASAVKIGADVSAEDQDELVELVNAALAG